LSGLGSYNNAVSFDDFRLRVIDSTPVDQPPAPTQVLGAPVGLAATAGNAQVSLSWTAVAGASGYRVYRGAVQVAQPATAAFTDTGLVNGQSYSYQVSAVNAAGESPKSLLASAVPVAPVNPPQTAITHGQEINASNTGFAAGGLTVADLVTQAGGTFSTNGQVIERRHFTSGVTLTGANQILRDCFIDVGEDENVMALRLEGTGTLVERVKVVARGRGGFVGVLISSGSGHTLRRVESSNFENTVTTYQNNVTIEESYLHDPASPYAGAHHDVVEIYGGNDVRIARSRMTMGPSETAVVNVAPWGGGSNSVNRVTIEDSFLDGGNMHFIFDNQAGGITMSRVLRNRLGGATAYGGYLAYRGPDANDPGIVHTAAAQASNPSSVLWPSTGPDINVWAVEQSLSPNRSGQLVQ
jgi:hypothetical protein